MIRVSQRIWLLGPIALYVLSLHYKFLYSDQMTYFVAPFRSLYPNFALNDWFTWNVTHVHQNFSSFVVFYSKFFGVEFGTFIVFVVMITIFCWISYKFVTFYGGDLLAYGLFLTLLLIGQNMGFGASRVLPTEGVLVPMDLTMPFILLSFYYVLQDKYAQAGLFAGIAGYFHINAFVLITLVFGIYFLINFSLLVRHRGYHFFLWFSLLSFPTFYSALHDFMGAKDFATSPEVAAVFDSFFWFHVSAHLWGPSIFLFMGLCHLLIWKRYREERTEANWRIFLFSVIIGALLIVAYVCSLPRTYNVFVVRLFLWRFSAVVMYFAYLFLSVNAATALRSDRGLEMIPICLLILTVFIAKYDYPLSGLLSTLLGVYLLFGHRSRVLALAVSGLAITTVIGAPFVLYTDLVGLGASLTSTAILAAAVFLWPTRVMPQGPVSYAFPTLVLLTCTLALSPLDPKVRLLPPHIYSQYDAAFEELIRWVRTETRPGELFLINPERLGFAIRTHRGTFVDKRVPLKDDEVKEWIKRLSEVYNTNTIQDIQRTQTSKFTDLDIPHLQSLCRKYGLEYLVLEGDPALLRARTSEAPVFQNEMFYVLKIDAQARFPSSDPASRHSAFAGQR
jgi:hypothetical protein